ncbi:unnamed protein product [Pedinophyceae sp. YPF-701]|nr:unnamed protein product [Pedinophyceae sp. YPF-701]
MVATGTELNDRAVGPCNREGQFLAAGDRRYRDRPADRAQAIDDRLEAFAEAFASACPEPYEDSVGAVNPETTKVFGRVFREGEGRPNENILGIEGSVARSQGASARLVLTKCPAFSVFPGQIVAVKGTSPSGTTLMATDICASYPATAGTPQRTVPEGFACRVVVAAGPYTAPGDLAFAPLQRLLARCKDVRPDMLLLMGPFVDSEHELVKAGTLGEDMTFADVLKARVLKPVSDFCGSAGGGETVVRIMYSPRDVTADPVLPQPRMDDELLDAMPDGEPAHENLKTMCNPATLAVGGEGDAEGLVVAGMCGDVLRHMGAVELSRNIPGDRIARLAGHLVAQRCFYPVYPPMLDAAAADGEMDASVMVEHTAADAIMMKALPHVLVLPSVLPPFAKPVAIPGSKLDGRVLCINPGMVSKGQYASLTLSKGSGDIMTRMQCTIEKA